MIKLDDKALAVVIDAEPVSVNETTWLVESVKLHEFELGLMAIETPTPKGAPLVVVALAIMLKYVGVHDEPQFELTVPVIVNWKLALFGLLKLYELTVNVGEDNMLVDDVPLAMTSAIDPLVNAVA
jgi:hypothetical protein